MTEDKMLNDLTKRLKYIDFSNKTLIPITKNDYIPFDFSIETLHKISENLKNDNRHFSFSKHIAVYDTKYLIKQKVKDTCLITALYNAYPILFNYDINIYNSLVKQYTSNDIKEIFGDKISLIDKPNLSKNQIVSTIEKSIDNLQPIILGTIHYPNYQHAVSFFGYDKHMLYYFDSGEKNTLVVNIIAGIELALDEYYSIQKLSRKDFKYLGHTWYYDLRQRMTRSSTKEYTDEIINELVKTKIIDYKDGLSGINKKLITEDTLIGWIIIKYNGIVSFSEKYQTNTGKLLITEDNNKCIHLLNFLMENR